MKTMMAMMAVGFVAVGAAMAQQADNLIRNPDFSVLSQKGTPEKWELDKCSAVDAKVLPEGCQASVSATPKEMSEGYGSIDQDVRDLKKGVTYVLSAKVKSTVKSMGFLEVKLFDESQSKELKRLDSKENVGTEWETITLEFKAEGSSTITVLCRYYQTSPFVGATVWFSDIKLAEKK